MPAADVLPAPDPVARSRATVVAGHVRITVLTDRLVRLEYAGDGQFEDRPSLAVVNRRFPAVAFDVTERGAGVVVDTGAVRIECTDTGRPFSRRTLGATIGRGRSRTTWRFGQSDRGNLGGTRRTLDGWKGDHRQDITGFDEVKGELLVSDWKPQRLDPGLLSRDGWVVVDDSGTVVLGPRTKRGAWPTPRPAGRRHDLYLFAHGHDFKGALGDGARLFGAQPLPPRFAFGYWYSRYYAYTDRELDAIAQQLDDAGVPLDVLVIDMDWHLPGWTGYTWDRRYFPDPDESLRRLRDRGLRVALNLHPAQGVGHHEAAFPDMCAAMGLDPDAVDEVPFDCADPRFVDAYFRLLHHPEERRGVDVWWMDWQQGKASAIPGLDPLPWLNHLHWDDQARRDRNRRPLVFSRWGGLGGGRHPIGFSGDAWSVWESLAFQPEFTATAANVLYGYWSHDIGGHYGPATTAELYARWVQFGAYSPVLRTHGTKDPDHERRVWEFPDRHRRVMVDALRRRYELVPYVYSECRQGVQTGLSLVRPMYHEHPEEPAAYEATGQYQFGDQMIVAPVVQPIDALDQMAAGCTWLPRGEWYDTVLGRSIRVTSRRGRWLDERYLLDEIPVFVRAGAIVPGQRDARRLDAPCYRDLVATAYPGGDGAYDLYEDDGISQGYLRGRSAVIPLRHRETASARSVRVGPSRGRYRGWVARRSLEVRFVGEPPPRGVRLGARRLEWSPGPGSDRWWYDAASGSVVVRLDAFDVRRGLTVRLDRGDVSGRRLLDGQAGLSRRLDRVAQLVGQVSPHYVLHPDERLPVDLAQAANRVGRDPAAFTAELRRVRRQLRRLDVVLEEFQEAWRTALIAPFSDPREQSVAILAEARGILATTLQQF